MTKKELQATINYMTNNLAICIEKIGESQKVFHQLTVDLTVVLKLSRLRAVVEVKETGQVRTDLSDLLTANLQNQLEVAIDLIEENGALLEEWNHD